MTGSLDDLRILELTSFIAGPFTCTTLAAMGAEVIKIEVPGSGDRNRNYDPFAGPKGVHSKRQTPDDISVSALKRMRGRKCITLNLKHQEGRRLFIELAKQSDVVVENLQPGTMDQLGIGYETLKEINPRIVFCSISGFGQSGPYRDRQAFDAIIQAMAGTMSVNGYPENPPVRTGFLAVDAMTPLYAVSAIIAAVRHRDRTGVGQFVDVSMFDCLVALQWEDHWDYYFREGIPTRVGNRMPRNHPHDVYQTRDGWVFIIAAPHEQWLRLCDLVGAPIEVRDDPAFVAPLARAERYAEIDAVIAPWVAAHTTEQAIAALNEYQIPCGPVCTIPDNISDPHVKHRGVLSPIRHPLLDEPVDALAANFPVKFSEMELRELQPAGVLGGQNAQVYGELLGLPKEELERLRGLGAI